MIAATGGDLAAADRTHARMVKRILPPDARDLLAGLIDSHPDEPPSAPEDAPPSDDD